MEECVCVRLMRGDEIDERYFAFSFCYESSWSAQNFALFQFIFGVAQRAVGWGVPRPIRAVRRLCVGEMMD